MKLKVITENTQPSQTDMTEDLAKSALEGLPVTIERARHMLTDMLHIHLGESMSTTNLLGQIEIFRAKGRMGDAEVFLYNNGLPAGSYPLDIRDPHAMDELRKHIEKHA